MYKNTSLMKKSVIVLDILRGYLENLYNAVMSSM